MRLREQDSVPQCEFASIGPARIQFLEQCVNEFLLVAKTGQKGQVNVLSESRSAPALHGHATDEAESPVIAPQQSFERRGRAQEFLQPVHEDLRRSKTARCSTN